MSDIQVMQISPYSNVSHKLSLFTQYLKNDAHADAQLLTIDTYIENDIRFIRLSLDCGVWTTIHPYNKTSGDILPRSVSVNLYDFFNIIDNCPDDRISIWIDDDSNELVVSSYYSETKELDELEVRLPIYDIPSLTDFSIGSDIVSTIELDQMSINTILTHMNYRFDADGVNFIINDGKLRLQSEFKNLVTEIELKSKLTIENSNNCSIYIPFNLFNMMASTGCIQPLQISLLTNNKITLIAEDFNFCINNIIKSSIDITSTEYKDLCVIDAKLLDENLKKFNKLTRQSKTHIASLEKVSDALADLTLISEKMSVSIQLDLAMLTNDVLEFDTTILYNMIEHHKLDAFRIRYKDTSLYLSYENGMIYKRILYR